MSRVKSILLILGLPILAVAVIACTMEKAKGTKMYLCEQQYALCTSAKCIPDPGDSSKTICSCDVYEGKSMSSVPCKELQPSTDKDGVRTVYSTFSLEQYKDGKKAMKCPEGTPWSWCLNKRCTVDPTHPQKALCVCETMRTGEWMTLGGDCESSTCETGYWSGATLTGNEEGTAFMMKRLGLEQSPVNWCPR